MIHIVTILMLSLLTPAHGGCPIKCNCTENAINCVSKSLEYVPYFESLTSSPIIIDLSGNSISLIDIDDFSFDKSDEVKEIYLNNSGLIAIEEGAFEELENLQELYLGENLLNSLPENFMVNNENMVLLDLSSNYFTEMPKIKSESLEVLTIANSGISKIANDALDELPNLRILLLPQNNLKTMNPIIFEKMSNLFFIRIAYNPWHCSCKTIKLFNYLTERKFVDLTEPVQCLREDKFFVDIYTDTGVAPAFKEQCSDLESIFIDDRDDMLEMEEISLKSLDKDSDSVTTSPSENPVTAKPESDPVYFSFYYPVILGIAIIFSLIIGAFCGSYITFKYMSRSIKQTESQKELLTKFDDVLSDNFT